MKRTVSALVREVTASGRLALWEALHIKGTVVLGALVHSSAVRMIGIDLDRLDRRDLDTLEATVAPEGLPPLD